MRLRFGCVTPWMGIGRAALLMAASWLALASGPARADFIIANQAGSTAASGFARYKDNGALMWSTPMSVYTNSSGITAEVSTNNALSLDGTTVYGTVYTWDSSRHENGGEIMVLDALTGAVKNIVPLSGLGFDHPYSIAAASDGTFWVTGQGSDTRAVHLNSSLGFIEQSAPTNVAPGGANGRHITVDGAGNPIISCCSSSTAALFKFDKNNLSTQQTVTIAAASSHDESQNKDVVTGVGRGVRWINNALYLALNTSRASFTTASGGCNYKDAIDKFTEDANGDLVEQGAIFSVLTPCAGNSAGVGFTNVVADVDGNFWVTQGNTNTLVKYSPTGQVLATITGLNGPTGLDYVYAPEPASVAVLGLGVAGLIASRRRNKR